MLLVKEIESIFLIVDIEYILLLAKLNTEFVGRNILVILNDTLKQELVNT